MAWNWPDIRLKIVIAVVWFFVGAGIMFLALTNKIFKGTPVRTTIRDKHESIKRRIR